MVVGPDSFLNQGVGVMVAVDSPMCIRTSYFRWIGLPQAYTASLRVYSLAMACGFSFISHQTLFLGIFFRSSIPRQLPGVLGVLQRALQQGLAPSVVYFD